MACAFKGVRCQSEHGVTKRLERTTNPFKAQHQIRRKKKRHTFQVTRRYMGMESTRRTMMHVIADGVWFPVTPDDRLQAVQRHGRWFVMCDHRTVGLLPESATRGMPAGHEPYVHTRACHPYDIPVRVIWRDRRIVRHLVPSSVARQALCDEDGAEHGLACDENA